MGQDGRRMPATRPRRTLITRVEANPLAQVGAPRGKHDVSPLNRLMVGADKTKADTVSSP
jgi:hypothetical protein